MAFKMKSIGELLGFSEKYSKPNSIVFEKNLPPRVMGEIDMNGVITIDGSMPEKQKASTVAHERGHLKQIRTGVLRFDTNNYYYMQLFNERRNMKEIDQMLEQWIKNSIIRAKFRKIIVKEINKYKTNTNTNG